MTFYVPCVYLYGEIEFLRCGYGGKTINEQDRRVIKTKESIENAFLALLGTKPLDKVTVVELARAARIHKSTFYLHYLDIPDLYTKTLQRTLQRPLTAAAFFPDLFDAPERFMRELIGIIMGNLPNVDLLMQEKNRYLVLDAVADMLRDKVYETGRLEKNRANDIKLDMLFGALLVCLPRYDASLDVVEAQAAGLIRLFFPAGPR